MMSKKSKGDLLEYMVAILEKTMSTDTTKIYPKYKLQDQHGVIRELDIYLEVNINNKIFRYAFECKNRKSEIQIKDITDFNSKISNLGLKGYFVTTSKYQQGAIKKATALNIELYTIRRSEQMGINMTVAKADQKFEIENTYIYFDGDTDYTEELKKCLECQASIVKIIHDDVSPKFGEALANLVGSMPEFTEPEHIFKTVDRENAISILIFIGHDCQITHKGAVVPISIFGFTLSIWNTLEIWPITVAQGYEYFDSKMKLLGDITFTEVNMSNNNLMLTFTRVGSNKQKAAVFKNMYLEEAFHVNGQIDIDSVELQKLKDVSTN